MTKNKPRAFTLIELLVVIAIIAILAAILFPVFVQAKEAAKQAQCISNMKQLGIAFHLYLSDHDDIWAPAANATPGRPGETPQQMWIGYDNNNAPLSNGWYGRVDQPAVNQPRNGAIDIYLKNYEIRVCPKKPGQVQLALAYNWFNPNIDSPFYDTHPEARGNEYGVGGRIVRTHAGGFYESLGANDSEVEETAMTLVLWEHDAHVPLCNFLQTSDWTTAPPNEEDLKEHFNFLHRNGTTSLWADTHARRMTYGQLRRSMFTLRKDLY